ncbi:MAG: hypothetical protein D3916_09840, partial [Candidatus Electrothrix sp. MAN1_4]|nr:hypothetical protein [Candidatus Electrothrix sp. MAN1_4]
MLDNCIARVWGQDGRIAGTAFLATKRYLLTCAHVVNFVFDKEKTYTVHPSESFEVDFKEDPNKRRVKVRVHPQYWYPCREGQPSTSDIAVLELLDSLPIDYYPFQFCSTGEEKNLVKVFGYPDDQGRWFEGKVLGPINNKWLQVDALSKQGEQICPGYSGAPVWSTELNGIIGMVVAYDYQLEKREGFIIPIPILFQAWPGLENPSLWEWEELKRALGKLCVLLAAIPVPSNNVIESLKKIEPHLPESHCDFDNDPLVGGAKLLKTHVHTTEYAPLFEFLDDLSEELRLNATGHQFKELQKWREKTTERIRLRSADRHFEVANRYYEQKNWKNAYDSFKNALQFNSRHYKANLYFGRTLIKVGQLSTAYKRLKTAYDLDPVESKQQQFSDAWIELVEEFRLENKIEEALQACDEALKIPPSDT